MTESSDGLELAQLAADVARDLDEDFLEDLLSALRDVPDARQARRLIERRTTGRASSSLWELFERCDHRTALLMLASSGKAASAIRKDLGLQTIVWTKPAVKAVAHRPTRQVAFELIARAKSRLTLVTYAGYDIADL